MLHILFKQYYRRINSAGFSEMLNWGQNMKEIPKAAFKFKIFENYTQLLWYQLELSTHLNLVLLRIRIQM